VLRGIPRSAVIMPTGSMCPSTQFLIGRCLYPPSKLNEVQTNDSLRRIPIAAYGHPNESALQGRYTLWSEPTQ
jgi:hypothetical protein